MFPSDVEFNKLQIGRPVIKWSQLPQGIYKIIDKKEFVSHHGESMILSLVTNSSDEKTDVWAPGRLIAELKYKPHITYLRNNGLKVSQKNTAHKYHSFDCI